MKRFFVIAMLCLLVLVPAFSYTIDFGAGIGFGHLGKIERDNSRRPLNKMSIGGLLLREHLDVIVYDISDSMFEFGACTKLAVIMGGKGTETTYTYSPDSRIEVKGDEAHPFANVAIMALARMNLKNSNLKLRLGLGLSNCGFTTEFGCDYEIVKDMKADLIVGVSTSSAGTVAELTLGTTYKLK